MILKKFLQTNIISLTKFVVIFVTLLMLTWFILISILKILRMRLLFHFDIFKDDISLS